MSNLNAWLRPNTLTDKQDYIAVIQLQGSIDVKDIIEAMQQEGMEIKPETALNIISRFNRKTIDMLLQGYNINTGILHLRPTIKGTFTDNRWDPQKHSLYASVSQGEELRKALSKTSVRILGEQRDPVAIYSITDITTGDTEGKITPGRNIEIRGSRIRIAGTDPSNGIYLRNLENNNTSKLQPGDIVINDPSRLLLLLPGSLASGTYELKITTQFSSHGVNLSQPRSVIADLLLTVL